MSGTVQNSTKKEPITLRQRLITTFVAFTAIPIILITVFAIFFYFYGIQSWFSERVSTAIEESQAVARAYLEEHTQAIRADTLAMANDLNRLDTFYYSTSDELEKVLQDQSYVRNLSEAIIFDQSGRVVARSGLTFSLEFEEIPTYAMNRANEGEVVVMTGAQDDRVRALVKLGAFGDSYLYAGRLVDPEVLTHLLQTAQASEDYQNLRSRYQLFQFTFTCVFIGLAFALIGMAVWFGLILSRQLVAPIKALMTASERVRAGDMRTRIKRQGDVQEFDYLADSFNRMTIQLEQQRGELIETNRKLDRRRQFTESVLTGVSAGVIGLDTQGVVTSANSSALRLLNKDKDNIVTYYINNIFPQCADLIERAHENTDMTVTEQVVYTRPDKTDRVFLIKAVVEILDNEDIGTVITFDDITDLQSAQRKAAWADVARRIAHEIKNPLTPIQLSAERLKRKYLSEIKTSPDIFEMCTDTIIHHVDDIERLVTSFSDFARMPQANKNPYDVQKLINEIIVFQSEAHSAIDFQIHGKTKTPRTLSIDPNLMRQAITNLLQNAIDAVEGVDTPIIQIVLQNSKKHGFVIAIEDNGTGFPKGKNTETLIEPYVTYKTKGTGLGLAIVQKVIEDHDGQLIFNRPEWFKPKVKKLSGASVLIVLDWIQFER